MLSLNNDQLEKLKDLINTNVSSANAQVLKAEVGMSSILVNADSILKVCQFLRDNKQKPFNVLQVISGVDYLEYIEVNYMLANFDLNNAYDFVLKVRLTDRVNPSLESVVSVWPAANFQERECYDMLGVTFKNHPDHRRILCPDDWEGFPLRKDYNAPKYYNGMEVFPDSKMNLEDREFIVRQKMIKEQQQGNAQ
jgi:NADH-quinone oxidoreductase subunit C